MIVTLDGPAGAGKSTTARALARRLGFRFLDTGAMYRAVAFAAAQNGLPWHDREGLVRLTKGLRIELRGDQVHLNGVDVSDTIRTTAVTEVTHYAANNPGVRAILVEWQRDAGGPGNLVTEGRDQGTVVFPQAQCKIFLTASPEERARRGQQDLAERGESLPLESVLAQQTERDRGDANRTTGPMVAASDSIMVSTDGLSPEQVVDRLEAIVRARLSQCGAAVDSGKD